MNKELQAYVEQAILPRYEHFDRAHGPEHARTVIEQSLALARHYQVDRQMVYAIAAYHDVGLEKGREMHHIHSGEILAADTKLRQWFSPQQIAVMREAVEDHRASSDHEPRTIYGRIVAEPTVIDRRPSSAARYNTGWHTTLRSAARGSPTVAWNTCNGNMPKAVTCGSGYPNRTTPANWRNCVR